MWIKDPPLYQPSPFATPLGECTQHPDLPSCSFASMFVFWNHKSGPNILSAELMNLNETYSPDIACMAFFFLPIDIVFVLFTHTYVTFSCLCLQGHASPVFHLFWFIFYLFNLVPLTLVCSSAKIFFLKTSPVTFKFHMECINYCLIWDLWSAVLIIFLQNEWEKWKEAPWPLVFWGLRKCWSSLLHSPTGLAKSAFTNSTGRKDWNCEANCQHCQVITELTWIMEQIIR